MVFIKGDCFEIGDHFNEGYYNEIKKKVCVDDYYIVEHETTQEQWVTLMGNNPSKNKICGLKCPVENVSWNEIQQFIKKLNNNSKKEYRLPTEAEWEFAAREGGKKLRFGNGKDILSYDDANFESLDRFAEEYSLSKNQKNKKILPVKNYPPNKLKIYDFVGNVSEWTNDWYFDQSFENYLENNSIYPKLGKFKIIKGGSFYEPPIAVRNSFRRFSKPDSKNEYLGFRLIIPIKNKTYENEIFYSRDDIANMIIEKNVSKGYISNESINNIELEKINSFLYPNFEITKNDLLNFIITSSKKSGTHQKIYLSKKAFLSSIKENDIALVKRYIKLGMDVNMIENDTGLTPLHVVAMGKNTKIAKILLKYGANVSSKDKRSLTPLLYAVNNNEFSMVNLLIRYGSNINLANNKGFTPLSEASRYGYLPIIKLLLKNNAKTDIKMFDGRIAIYGAVKNKHFEIVKLLEQAGSPIRWTDKNGVTLLDLAIENNQTIMINFLELKGLAK